MRTFCPRVLVHGPSGMGQKYLGAAVLHHLEGFHVQTLDLGTLMGDSTKVRFLSHLTQTSESGQLLTTVPRGGLGSTLHRGKTTPTLRSVYPFLDRLRIRSQRYRPIDIHFVARINPFC